jgi:hypothetical protein
VAASKDYKARLIPGATYNKRFHALNYLEKA